MRKTIGIAIAAAALLVACGSDDNDAATTEAPSTEAPMSTEAPAEEPERHRRHRLGQRRLLDFGGRRVGCWPGRDPARRGSVHGLRPHQRRLRGSARRLGGQVAVAGRTRIFSCRS